MNQSSIDFESSNATLANNAYKITWSYAIGQRSLAVVNVHPFSLIENQLLTILDASRRNMTRASKHHSYCVTRSLILAHPGNAVYGNMSKLLLLGQP